MGDKYGGTKAPKLHEEDKALKKLDKNGNTNIAPAGEVLKEVNDAQKKLQQEKPAEEISDVQTKLADEIKADEEKPEAPVDNGAE